jgi:hypothetical protein
MSRGDGRVERAGAGRPRGWGGAVAIALAVSVAAVLVLMVVPQLILTRLGTVARDVRVGLATGWIGLATAGLLVAAYRASDPGRAPTDAAPSGPR